MNQKTVFITGTSSGFGQLTVTQLLRSGHRVIAGLRGGDERGRKIFSAHTSLIGNQLIFLDLELGDASRLHDNLLTLDKILRDHFSDRLDTLILNAGYGQFGAMEDTSDTQLRQQFEVNFFSAVTMVRHLLPRLRRAHGRILILSSIAGRFTFPFYGSYSASKYALEALMEGLHYDLQLDLAPRVQLCLIEPGGYATAFNKNVAQAQRPGSPYAGPMGQLLNFLRSAHRKAGDPQHVAALINRYVSQPRIPVRKIMGKDARMLQWISALIPDAWRIKLTYLFYQKVIFKN